MGLAGGLLDARHRSGAASKLLPEEAGRALARFRRLRCFTWPAGLPARLLTGEA
jgi:hypothetical protein